MGNREDKIANIEAQIEKVKTCGHPKTEIRKKKNSWGIQCLRCGRLVGEWIPKRNIDEPEKCKPFDDALQANYSQSVYELVKALNEEKRKAEKEDFDGWYAEYLKSPEWLAKRGAVLNRCARTCEGCGKNPATVVHHMTYQNAGNEFLFELVGLCRACHDRYHGKAAA